MSGHFSISESALKREAGTRVGYVGFWRRHADYIVGKTLFFKPYRYAYIRGYFKNGMPVLPIPTLLKIPEPAAGQTVTVPPPSKGTAKPPAIRITTAQDAAWIKRAREMWKELHTRALAYKGEVAAEQAWLREFALRVKCGTCRQHWNAMTAKTPPDLSSADAYFAWTVDRHNEVNALIDADIAAGKRTDALKPLLAVEDARGLWTASPTTTPSTVPPLPPHP
ncbi:MAG TPA: ERV1/ALR-related protein [Phycisphaerae bacterium]|nr:ERV1/ALR-related protein [Phycisphaerae bacterium]